MLEKVEILSSLARLQENNITTLKETRTKVSAEKLLSHYVREYRYCLENPIYTRKRWKTEIRKI